MRDILYENVNVLSRSKASLFVILTLAYISIYVILGASSSEGSGMILEMDVFILLVVQGISSALMFWLIPWLFLRFGVGFKEQLLETIDWKSLAWIFLIVFSNLIVLSVVIEWNISLDLPDGWFENWASGKEAELKVLTEHLINFQGFGHFLLALVVMAVVPAIGEEILFRGLLQNLIKKVSGNAHLAIWISAFLFSAIHLQFYGFFPRFLLGALFGYLYLWSGKLSTAVLAHFFHNGLALVFAFMAGMSSMDIEPEQMEQSAPWALVGVFLVIGVYGVIKFVQLQKEDG